MNAPKLNNRFNNPSESQASLLALLQACQQQNGEPDWFSQASSMALEKSPLRALSKMERISVEPNEGESRPFFRE